MKITEKIKTVIMGLAAVVTLGSAAVIAPTVHAADNNGAGSSGAGRYINADSADAKFDGNNNGQGNDLMTVLQVVINVVLGVVGFLAVAMIIIGGIQYTTSAGDAQRVTKAKNTILYGVVGLVIALLAFAIVNFILTNVFKTS